MRPLATGDGVPSCRAPETVTCCNYSAEGVPGSVRLGKTSVSCAIITLSIEYFPNPAWTSRWLHPCSPCQPPSNHRATATRCGGSAGCRLRRRRHLRRGEAAALTRSDVECWAGRGASPAPRPISRPRLAAWWGLTTLAVNPQGSALHYL